MKYNRRYQMAHEIENMFSVQQVPWHKLGIVVEKSPSIEEAIKLAGLDWEVGLKKLFTPEGTEVDALATYRTSDNAILGVVGSSYKPLQNKDAFNFFNPFLEAKVASLETAGSLREGKRIWVLAKINKDPIEIVKGDDIVQYVLLSNSHDGTLAVRVGFTPVRVVCANTLAMAHGNNASRLLRVKHTGSVVENLEKIQDIMNVANQQFEATAAQYRLLASKDINQQDLEKYVKKVFAINKTGIAALTETTEGADSGSRVLAKIIPLFESGRGNDLPGVKGTLWGAYNAITEYVQYERGKDESIRLDNTWFGTGAALNRKALDTAIEFAQAD